MATASYVGKFTVDRNGGGEQTLGGINNISIGLNKTLVDVSSMNGTDDHVKRLAALKDFPITVSGFFDASDAAYTYLKDDFVSGSTSLTCKVYYAAGGGFDVDGVVESIDFSASVDGAMEVSITIQSNDDVNIF